MKTIIMAGGRSRRFGQNCEKALIRLSGKTLLERVADAATKSRANDLAIATSLSTPSTEEFAKNIGLQMIRTPGKGYHDDVYYLLDRLGNYISINVDIPFIDVKSIDFLCDKIRKTSIACVIPRDRVTLPLTEDSVGIAEDGKNYVWIGLNFVTPSPKTDILIFEDELLALNINTPEDLRLAETYLAQQKR